MTAPPKLWGLHQNAELGAAAIEQGFVAIGWNALGDLSLIPASRDGFKAAIAGAGIAERPGAIPVWAGVLYRFVHEMKPGDVVVYPSKSDRMVHIGRIEGGYLWTPDAGSYPNRRRVRWERRAPRTDFSQSALHEIGSAITLFQITTHADAFLAALEGRAPDARDVDDVDRESVEEVSAQVEESTEDFILKRLKSGQSPYQFEKFVAHLLTCMGYHARVTKGSGDGGVDVIAHRDELGFEPPIIKVQVKQVLDQIGRPAVQQLHGAIEPGEHGLFVTLGGYSNEARVFERGKPNLRLIDGAALIGLIYNHYDRFEPSWQRLLPLRRVYIPGSVAASED